jgi:hypothetical protein
MLLCPEVEIARQVEGSRLRQPKSQATTEATIVDWTLQRIELRPDAHVARGALHLGSTVIDQQANGRATVYIAYPKQLFRR